VSKLDLKTRVMRKMANEESDDWQLIKGKLREALGDT
jgi:hypothetical protein